MNLLRTTKSELQNFLTDHGEPDFLLIQENQKIILDTKYKKIYQNDEYKIA